MSTWPLDKDAGLVGKAATAKTWANNMYTCLLVQARIIARIGVFAHVA